MLRHIVMIKLKDIVDISVVSDEIKKMLETWNKL